MKNLQLLRFSVLFLVGVFSLAVFAGSDHDKADKPIPTISGILADLNHYPSDEEKAVLKEIAGNADTSAHVQTIASVVHDMQHSVSAGDKEKLAAIMQSEDADPQAKELAAILININHKPDAQAREKLMELRGGETP